MKYYVWIAAGEPNIASQEEIRKKFKTEISQEHYPQVYEQFWEDYMEGIMYILSNGDEWTTVELEGKQS